MLMQLEGNPEEIGIDLETQGVRRRHEENMVERGNRLSDLPAELHGQ